MCPQPPTPQAKVAQAGDEVPEVKVKATVAPQLFACMSASLGALSSGSVNGWTAGTLTALDEDPDIHMGTAETAWTVGIISLGSLLASTVAGPTMDVLGRRKTLLVMSPLMVAGWLVMALVPGGVAALLVGRAVCGVATAFLFSAPSVYCSEVPVASLRGRLGSLPSFCITVGVVLSYLAGALCSWRVSCYVCMAPTLLMMACMARMPESPYWLMLKGRRGEAEDVMTWLRGPHYDWSDEMKEMEDKIGSVGRRAEYQELLRPRTRKPFGVSLFMMALQQLSGGNVLMMYTSKVFQSAGFEDQRVAVILTGAVQLIATLVCVLTVDFFGRRPFIVLSTAVMGVSISSLGVYYLMREVVGVAWPQWVALTTVLVGVSGYCLGCRTLPWLLAAELFNTTIRSTANTASIFFSRCLNLVVIQAFPFFEEAAGTYTVFFVHGVLNIIFSLSAYMLVPETKGKTLEEIQEYFEDQARKGSRKSTRKGAEDEDRPKVESKLEEGSKVEKESIRESEDMENVINVEDKEGGRNTNRGSSDQGSECLDGDKQGNNKMDEGISRVDVDGKNNDDNGVDIGRIMGSTNLEEGRILTPSDVEEVSIKGKINDMEGEDNCENLDENTKENACTKL